MNMEIAKEFQKQLLDHLARVDTSLKAITLVQLADEFYTKEERCDLYGQFAQLRTEDSAAFETLIAVSGKDDLGWEERVKRFGEDVAKEQLAPVMAARELRQKTMAALSKFESDHGLIVNLFEQKNKFRRQF